MPNFVIGRSGYDLYLVETAYLDTAITMIDVTNTGVSSSSSLHSSALRPHAQQGRESLGHQAEDSGQRLEQAASPVPLERMLPLQVLQQAVVAAQR